MPDFSVALTGLQADSIALNTIGNNLSNLNTTAYKGQTTSFEDLFYQQMGSAGSNDTVQVGVGTKVSNTDTDFTEGTIGTTTGANNMALNGNGFFVVEQNGVQYLTRAGNFQVGADGSLTDANGASVMGYQASNGVIGQTSSLSPLTIPIGQNQPAKTTQNITVTESLDSTAATGAQFSSPVTVYDSLGQSHVATINYTKTGTTTWDYSISLPAGESTGTPVNNTGTLTFDNSGNLVSPTGSVSGISFPGLSDGASDLTFNWNLNDSNGNPVITQAATASNVVTSSQDGYASGTYQSFAVDPQGIITASYSNGNSFAVGQIAVASIVNPEGLTRAGGNEYLATPASGSASIGIAGTGGRATIDDFALEQSNVDISTEFSNLIIAQRAFEANSKTVTTFDTVTQDAISMLR